MEEAFGVLGAEGVLEGAVEVADDFDFLRGVAGPFAVCFRMAEHGSEESLLPERGGGLQDGEVTAGVCVQDLPDAEGHFALIDDFPMVQDVFFTAQGDNFFAVRADDGCEAFLYGIVDGVQEEGDAAEEAGVFARAAFGVRFCGDDGEVGDAVHVRMGDGCGCRAGGAGTEGP